MAQEHRCARVGQCDAAQVGVRGSGHETPSERGQAPDLPTRTVLRETGH